MQEAYFKSRSLNYHKELLGQEDSKDEEATIRNIEEEHHQSKKITKSKQTLIKILEEDRGSSSSSRQLPRSQSDFRAVYK